MSVSTDSKEKKVPQLVLELQSICDELADAKRRFMDVKSQIDDFEIGDFTIPINYDTEIQAVEKLKHIDGAMVNWTVGKMNDWITWLTSDGRMAAINNLRTGAS